MLLALLGLDDPKDDDDDVFFSSTIFLLPSSNVILICLYPVPVGAAKLLEDNETPGAAMLELLPTEGTTYFPWVEDWPCDVYLEDYYEPIIFFEEEELVLYSYDAIESVLTVPSVSEAFRLMICFEIDWEWEGRAAPSCYCCCSFYFCY